MDKNLLNRINELAKKKREQGLTPDEQAEQKKLSKKKMPLRRVAPSAAGDQGSAFGNRKPLKRLEPNFKTGEKMKLVDLPADTVYG